MRYLILVLAFSVVLMAGCLQEQPPAGNASGPTQPTPEPQSCVDSDGNDPWVKGNVTFGSVVREDSCESDTVLRENYCEGGNPASELVMCAQDTVCIEGACVPTNAAETPALCTDGDGGKEYGTAGSVSYGGRSYTDACQGAYDMLEYYCDGDAMAQTTYHCPSGQKCENDACISLNASCSDPDHTDPLVVGTTTQYGGGMVVSSKTDYCIDNRTRNEYYCQDNAIVNSSMACPAGTYCAGGACVLTCNDLDGENYSKASYVVDAAGKHYDYCQDDKHLIEYFCSNGAAGYRSVPCGGVCHKDRCYSSSELTCRESGDVTLKAGSDVVKTYNDTCADYQTVMDYKCISNKVEYVYEECEDKELCEDADCKAIIAAGCYDMDADEGDDDIYAASEVVLTSNDSIEDIKWDYCTNEAIVAEFYCEGEHVRADFFSCPADYRCVGGACTYPYTCADTDAGQDLTPGSVSLMDGDTVVRTERDACSDDTHVHEVFCSEDGRMAYAILTCPAGTACDSTNGSCK